MCEYNENERHAHILAVEVFVDLVPVKVQPDKIITICCLGQVKQSPLIKPLHKKRQQKKQNNYLTLCY